MGATSIIALLGVIETLIQDTPQAIQTFQNVKTMLVSGTEPTQAQWAQLDAQLASSHKALQALFAPDASAGTVAASATE